MTEYRRLLLPGATYFFTVRLETRGSTLLTDHVNALRYAYAKAVTEFPVTCHAMVVLPDHLHAIWTEPTGEVWYAERWRRIKTRFAQGMPPLPDRSSHEGKREPALWQRRFSEYAIRTESDFRLALDHCRMNAVKHGLVTDPALWPYSSFNKSRNLPQNAVRAKAEPEMA